MSTQSWNHATFHHSKTTEFGLSFDCQLWCFFKKQYSTPPPPPASPLRLQHNLTSLDHDKIARCSSSIGISVEARPYVYIQWRQLAAITHMASRVPIHILRAVSGVRANLPSGAVTLDKALSAVDDEGLRLRQLQHDERAKGVMDRLKGHKRRQKAATDTRGDIVRYIDEALRLNTLVRSATAAAVAATAALADAPYFSELQSFQAAIDSDWFDELQRARQHPSRGLLEPEEAASLRACEQQLENEIAELCRDVKAMLAPAHAAAAAAAPGSVDELTALDSLHSQSQQLGLNEQGAVAVYQRAAAAIADLDSGFVNRLAAAHALQLPPPTCAHSSDVRARFSKVWREAFATNRPRAVYLRQLQIELQLSPAECISIDTWHASVRKSAAASEREIAAWKKSRAAVVTAAYDQLLALAAAELAAAEYAADSECVRCRVSVTFSPERAAGTGSASARLHALSCSCCDTSTRHGCGSRKKKEMQSGC
jgi:hypothetical protein